VASKGSRGRTMERVFWEAARRGKSSEVEEILRDNPAINVNWKNEEKRKWTALHEACENGHASVVAMLLAHPGIDVNTRTPFGDTPFKRACWKERTSCFRLMLGDSRVDLNKPDAGGYTPLRTAACHGELESIQWWIASGREMDLGRLGNRPSDAIKAASESPGSGVGDLLESFKENPLKTRHKVRTDIGWHGPAAAVFALVVFLSDGLLEVSQGKKGSEAAFRFFAMIRRLPLELQMVLCFVQTGSGNEIIPSSQSEAAFKALAKTVQKSS